MKNVISTTEAPGAIGPYSQGIDLGNIVFCSGQIPVDPATGLMPEGITAQTEQAIANVKALLKSIGLGLKRCQDNSFLSRHRRLCGDERGVCFALRRAVSRPLGCGRQGPAQGCYGRGGGDSCALRRY